MMRPFRPEHRANASTFLLLAGQDVVLGQAGEGWEAGALSKPLDFAALVGKVHTRYSGLPTITPPYPAETGTVFLLW